MKTNDDTIDKLIAGSIKNLGLDEPSSDFTLRVMQTIAIEEPVVTEKPRNYWWLFTLIPVLIGLGWYILNLLELTGKVAQFWTKTIASLQPLLNTILSIPNQLKGIKISPILIFGFIAIILLLAIEELISRTKHAS